MERFIVISGCSGGGKSTLLAELRLRGYGVFEEPGRRIVADELAGDGSALPWVDGAAFARKAIKLALADRFAADEMRGMVFFDRGLIDAAVALQKVRPEFSPEELCCQHRYNRHVFIAPPWPEIYVQDAERRHDFRAAEEEYHRLLGAYPRLGYRLHHLPKVGVTARADFVLNRLETAGFRIDIS